MEKDPTLPLAVPNPEAETSRLHDFYETTIDRARKAKAIVAPYAAALACGLGGTGVAVAVAACGSSHNSDPTVTALTAANANSDPSVEQACGVPMDLKLDVANHTFGSSEAVMPSLEAGNNPNQLIDKATAVERMQKQVAEDSRVAAIMSLLYEIRDGQTPPNTLSLGSIAKEQQALELSTQYASGRVAYVCEQLNYIVSNSSEAYLGGDAGMIGLTRPVDASGVTGAEIKDITKDRTIAVYELGSNLNNTNLTDQDKAYLVAFQQAVAVGADGVIYIKHLAAPQGHQPRPNPNHGNHQQNQASHPIKGLPPVPANLSQHLNGGGQYGTSNGNGENNQPGSVREHGGKPGHKPGKQRSFGPPTTPPPTTRTETVTTTTPPPTTTTETVTTTTPPPTTTTSTTPTPVKPPQGTTTGPGGCDPNMGQNC